ncbi:MAG: tetratricopeptide repeat protein [Bacteroidetes bacterium]|nr:MAG: tetratricopeptide repeat protein [Bacteroidota bacterium]TNE99128.1 MAG: tetratricopeptide repeat protein [Bacteroidota bacterium]
MFDDNEDEEYYDDDLSEDLERFERFLKGEDMGFLDSDRWEALVDNFILSGQYNKAVKAADEALTQFSYNDLFRLRKAQAFSGMGKLKDAINLLSELEGSSVSPFEVSLTKAAIFSQLRDSNNAIRYFKEALDLADEIEKDEVYIDLALEYQNKGDYQLSINVLQQALRENPHNETAVYELAHCFEQLNDLEGAVKCYSDFIDDNPYSFTAWYNLGNTYSRQENFDKALWAYDYCLLINDKFGPVHFNMGNAYMNQEKFTKAIQSFSESLALDGDDPVAHSYLGECYEQIGDYDHAKEHYQKGIELAPELAEPWLGLGIVADLEGNTKAGLPYMHKAYELDPDNTGILHVLAGAYEKLEDKEQADFFYQRVLELDPDDDEALINYIDFLKKDSPLIAYTFINRFADEGHEDVELIEVIRISLLYEMGKKEDAERMFRELAARNRELAKELFYVNPDLKNAPEFVLLGE